MLYEGEPTALELAAFEEEDAKVDDVIDQISPIESRSFYDYDGTFDHFDIGGIKATRLG